MESGHLIILSETKSQLTGRGFSYMLCGDVLTQAEEGSMTKSCKIAASVLAADFTRLGEQIREAEAGGTDFFHLDVMDGHFVPNISFGPMVVQAVNRLTRLFLDVHLMIEKPERYLEAFAHAGASMLNVHVET